MEMSFAHCLICPRKCGADRTVGRGYCGASDTVEISKVMLHHWEEPCISGGANDSRGSGAVFFTHCPLGCVFCQNRDISRPSSCGGAVSVEELAEIFLKLQKDGAYNINLVSPTQYTPALISAVHLAKEGGLHLPIVWNTGGYELPETVEELRDTVDIFLTDFKYASSELAARCSLAENYPENAALSLSKMVELVGECRFDENGMMTRGVIVRHLVLPGERADSMNVLRKIAEVVSVRDIRMSLMAQYTPEFLPPSDEYKKFRRKITSFEYRSVLDEAERLGFDGYSQERTSAVGDYTPNF